MTTGQSVKRESPGDRSPPRQADSWSLGDSSQRVTLLGSRASSNVLVARLVAVIRQASSRSSRTSWASASSSRTLTHADEFVVQPASYTVGAVASRASRSSWCALIIAWFSGWLTHAKPLPLNVMFVQLGHSLRTTSGSSVDISTSWEEESASCLLTPVIIPPVTDRLPGAEVLARSAADPDIMA